MKKHWDLLSEAQKKKYRLSTLLLVVVMILLVINPLEKWRDYQHTVLAKNNNTLSAMLVLDQELNNMDTQEKPKASTPPGDLWSTVNAYKLPAGLKLTLDQNNQTVIVTSPEIKPGVKPGVNFSLLAGWLVWLWQQHGIRVTDADIIRVPDAPMFVTITHLTLSA